MLLACSSLLVPVFGSRKLNFDSGRPAGCSGVPRKASRRIALQCKAWAWRGESRAESAEPWRAAKTPIQTVTKYLNSTQQEGLHTWFLWYAMATRIFSTKSSIWDLASGFKRRSASCAGVIMGNLLIVSYYVLFRYLTRLLVLTMGKTKQMQPIFDISPDFRY